MRFFAVFPSRRLGRAPHLYFLERVLSVQLTIVKNNFHLSGLILAKPCQRFPTLANFSHSALLAPENPNLAHFVTTITLIPLLKQSQSPVKFLS